ncbi:HSF-type DNA-binding-domain-containing protein, partial [Fennellomyces sp. T-0311]
ILEDDENRGLISWSSCGEFFRIYDSDEFARAVLPRYFRHSNWTSFVRQLN